MWLELSPSYTRASCFSLQFAKIPQGFGTGDASLLFGLALADFFGRTFYRQVRAAWRGLRASDESLLADETARAALSAG